jgi:hypothetical protein
MAAKRGGLGKGLEAIFAENARLYFTVISAWYAEQACADEKWFFHLYILLLLYYVRKWE